METHFAETRLRTRSRQDTRGEGEGRKSFLILPGERSRWISPPLSKWRLESGRRRMSIEMEKREAKESLGIRIPHSCDTYRNDPPARIPYIRIPRCRNSRQRWMPVNCWPFSQISSLSSLLCTPPLSGIHRNFLEKSRTCYFFLEFPCTPIPRHDLSIHVAVNLSILGIVYRAYYIDSLKIYTAIYLFVKGESRRNNGIKMERLLHKILIHFLWNIHIAAIEALRDTSTATVNLKLK